ncbi:hypothetical protein ASPWEDRAFT_739269 [Aspergillus wentii DTO 134E9]|uniref:Uncharacterized protein n=1 Tax=Aspergillus wentii DTO 134E9 TaxID=1073089 RepID=A0A1L9RSU8_ASPWE|nr:uncharacterized protein ASPWEDRAFT_739269 [Aspergillus wentii DTO 134E9]OJJ37974.1 hypothetical protein ASPWEDRAFT_739269 [Aspergillus wentii DTO 134E9]
MAPIVPSSSAGPAEVRKYLIHLLMTKHDVAKEAAEEIASHWDIARGSDLREAYQYQFQQIFGDGYGYYMYKSVQEDIWSDTYRAVGHFICYTPSICFLIICLKVMRKPGHSSEKREGTETIRGLPVGIGLGLISSALASYILEDSWWFLTIMGGIYFFISLLGCAVQRHYNSTAQK